MGILLKKAKFIIYGENGKPKSEINCAFNPSQYVIKSTANYKEDHSFGTDTSRMIFLSGTQKELSLTLFFDSVGELGRTASQSTNNITSDTPPVTDQTKQITSAIQVSGEEHKPPLVAFQWGNLNFKGVLLSVTETFTMFDTFGKPIRAKLDLVLKASQSEEMTKKAEPFESPDRTKYRTFVEGMSLWSIAQEEYGDCTKWRYIAKENELKHPLHVQPGQILKIPAL